MHRNPPTKQALHTVWTCGFRDSGQFWTSADKVPALCLVPWSINVQQGSWTQGHVWVSASCPMTLCTASACFHSFIHTALVMFCVCPSVVFGCLGASGHDSSVWVIKHTHAVISTTPSQNRLEALEGCWTEPQLQLACSVTVYTITPFKICQLQRWACQNSSDCCLVVSTFPCNISLHIYNTISPEWSSEVCGTEEHLYNDL